MNTGALCQEEHFIYHYPSDKIRDRGMNMAAVPNVSVLLGS